MGLEETVLLRMYENMIDNNRAYTTIKELASQLLINEASVRTVLSHLEKKGQVLAYRDTVFRCGGGEGPSLTCSTTIWVIGAGGIARASELNMKYDTTTGTYLIDTDFVERLRGLKLWADKKRIVPDAVTLEVQDVTIQ